MDMTSAALAEKAKLVLDRLMHLEGRQFAEDVDPWKGNAARDFGIATWDWPQGVGLYSMEILQDAHGDTRYDEFFAQWVERNIQDGLPSANINTTAPYIMLLSLAQRTGDERYRQMCIERAEFLMHELPRTTERGFQHVTTDIIDKNGIILNEQQLWVDTLFMAVVFLASAGVAYDRPEWVEESIYQILLHVKYLYDTRARLLYHGWSFARGDNFGGIHWARGNSWYTYGILKLIDVIGERMTPSVREHVLNTLRAQVDALVPLQSESGLWHTVLEDPTSYEEVSGSAGFVAGMMKAMREGLLGEAYLPVAERAIADIVQNIDANGSVRKVSGGTSMGMDAQHYKDIIVAEMPYGQAMTALALLEAAMYYKDKEAHTP